MLVLYAMRIIKATEKFRRRDRRDRRHLPRLRLRPRAPAVRRRHALHPRRRASGSSSASPSSSIASLNLILDFDFIEKGVAAGAPKHLEWYAGFGLLVTLVWVYLEMLRLLSKLRRLAFGARR